MNLELIGDAFDSCITDVTTAHGETTLVAVSDILIPLCRFLKEHEAFAFDFLTDLCGVDRMPASPRFLVVYHLYSTRHGHRLRLKVPVDEGDPAIDSCVSVWAGADWHERECFDLLGIVFKGHPNLQRILLPPDFEGHSLRKDFPLAGMELT
jgi:NADH-quinone oxidoreductase subunit C